MELMRQPVFLLLTTASASFSVFLASISYFGLGGEFRMVKDSAMAVMFLSGLFGAVISASASVAHEIRSGTALAVLSKPVGRAQFLLGKYLGLAGAVAVLSYVNTVAVLMASRMAFDAYGDTDLRSLGLFFGAVALAYAAGGFSNYFLRRNFTADALMVLVITVTIAGLLVAFTGASERANREDLEYVVDWRLVPATVLIFLALLLVAAVALACSTRLDIIPTLAVCTGVFLLGLISDYLFGQRAEQGSWWAAAVYAAVPNWQLFWMADALDGTNKIPWSYVTKAAGYVAAYLGAMLALALLMFEDRDLG
jgi:ABC-type transport system involved in multi-copper enzyme maturation permease subunit